MQNNLTLEHYDSSSIAAISNQLITTLFTRNNTKIKLKNKIGLYNVTYKLENLGKEELDSKFFHIENNILYVDRVENINKSAKLAVYLIDGGNEVYVNSWELRILTEEQSKTYELQEMRYNNNKLSYLCGMLGILFSLVASIIILNSAAYSWASLFFILITIGMVLVGFLASEKTKTYKINYSYVMLALGIICIILIFWYPLSLIINYQNLVEAREQLAITPDDAHWKEVLNNSINNLGIAVTGDANTQAMLPQSGTLRGIISIVLLLIAAASYIYGAFNAYIKSKRLNQYLESLNDKR